MFKYFTYHGKKRMFQYSKSSLAELETAHPDLQAIFHEVIKVINITILQGHRGELEQNLAYNTGKSQIKWPDGKHNKTPSMAVDTVPYPVDWESHPKNLARFYYMAGVIKAVAERLFAEGKITHRIRQGCDWNGNMDFTDQTFDDLPHTELIA
jgi:peptidoglycan L-alanyl-D-glutamate endopeptidase CwlK